MCEIDIEHLVEPIKRLYRPHRAPAGSQHFKIVFYPAILDFAQSDYGRTLTLRPRDPHGKTNCNNTNYREQKTQAEFGKHA
jgi:hypothetical protein